MELRLLSVVSRVLFATETPDNIVAYIGFNGLAHTASDSSRIWLNAGGGLDANVIYYEQPTEVLWTH